MKKVRQKNSSSNQQNKDAKAEMKKSFELLGKTFRSQINTMKSGNRNKITHSIGVKLLIIMFVSIVLCVSAVGTISFQKAKSLLESNVSAANVQTINQVGNSIDTVLKSYIDVSFQIMFDNTIITAMKTLLTTDNTYEQLEANRNLTEKLSNYMVTNTTIRNIAIVPMSEKIEPYINGTATNLAVQRKKGEQYRSTDWFQTAVEEAGAAVWVEPQAEGIIDPTPYRSVALSRLVRDLGNPDQSYMLVLEFDAQNLFSAANDVDLGKNSEVVILNNQHQFVFSQNEEAYGTEPKIVISESTTELTADSRTVKGADEKSYLAVFQTLNNYDQWRVIAAIPVEVFAAQAAPIGNITVIICIIAAFIAIAVGIFIMRNIGAPLAKLSGQMEKGAGGDLTVRASIKERKDEIGTLSKSFDMMMEQISLLATQTTSSAAEVLKTASELSETSNKTAIASREIAVATDEIAGGASSLAVEAEKGTDLTSRINEQMDQMNQYANNMSQSAQEVERASQQGTSYMAELIDKTGTTEQMTRAMVDKVNKLKESTTSIVKILDVLNAVTKQTNILSLNATIEAARAGAAGKGFMVVADEIRQLADQSRQSIEVVADITTKITTEIEETVAELDKAYPLFQDQINSVKEANQLFLSVQAQMDGFKDSMNLVKESIDDLNQSQHVLSDSMNNVSAVAQQSSATSEEVASLSTEQLNISENLVQLSNQLQQVSNSLKDSLSKFKI
ncbi:methyl-accepting chemotaxis protein [Paenibacillus camelliae]|uniref:methyl-accepting chemotaxis protein n=1 Tax=Paenibacillus camelliae TaxID=512410 RepID=UPI00204176C9|nr:methyl-accepting chemotaxis protein [Paenibacillus camelliae]MCM3632384.1 methyl-accepting chemotaxis protein [Paenibacillus camelliae]